MRVCAHGNKTRGCTPAKRVCVCVCVCVCVYKWKSVFQQRIHFCCCSFMSEGKDHSFLSMKLFVKTRLGRLCP